MPGTYTSIATTTLGSSAADITFSSIPGTYTDLVLVCTLKAATASSDIYMRFNSDTGSNYSNTIFWANGTSVGSNRFTSAGQIRLNYTVDVTTTDGTILVCNINSYSSANLYKSPMYKLALASDAVDFGVSSWRSTSAITSIALTLASGNWGSGSTATLYGIKAA